MQQQQFNLLPKLKLELTCGSGPLLCMAVTSLNFLLAIYKVFEDPIWGLNNNNNNLNLL